jgi:hypothetical protein
VCVEISDTDKGNIQNGEYEDKIKNLEDRIDGLVKLNNDLHKRVFDLEGQVIKANDNLHKVIKGMRDYINKTTLPILRIPFIETLNYVENLIDWGLVIDASRYETEKKLSNNGDL